MPGGWNSLKVVDQGPSAYSAIAVLPNRTAALVLCEAGWDLPDPCQGHDPCWQQLSVVSLNV
eukprot:SAG31_NODE_586_length_13839_cov_22.698544_3_plen_62_part_00